MQHQPDTHSVQPSTDLTERAENWRSYVERHGENWWSVSEAFAIVNDMLEVTT